MNGTAVLDLAVIGSGGAAMAAAIAARQAGKTVTLVEAGTLGGTCVNIGCVPSKTLLAAAGARHTALTNPFPGAPTSAGPVDLCALVAQKDDLVAGLRHAKYAEVAAAYGVEVVAGLARFSDPETLRVDGRPLPARAYLIATGAKPALPDLPGLHRVDWLTSTTAMELAELPESLIVIGGGYVGLEQAQLFAHLGTRVTLIGRVAPTAEPELAAVLRTVFADDAITVFEEHAVAVETTAPGTGRGSIMVTTRSGQHATAERVLVATGRTPRTAALDLDAAAVKTDNRGFVVVDAHQRSSNPRIYAAGDVAGAPQYVYVAAATGRVAALNATGHAGTSPATVDYTGLPAVIFTHPQLATAGLTETQALAAGHRTESRVLALSDVPRALANRDTRGAVKLVADADTGRVLGVHAAADGAGEIMLAATYAIKARMTVEQIADTWAPYLTMAESLRLVAGSFRTQMPASCCA
jgi:mercuric reductase